jgi:hypothetical protein
MKNHFFRSCVLAVTFLLFGVNCTFAQSSPITEVKTVGGIATLYAIDPLARSFCFGDGREGGVFQQNEARNRCSDIDFNAYNEGSLTVGIEGGRTGAILDLGSTAELQKRYGYSETVGAGQGFASLRSENGKVFILKDRQTHTEQEMSEAALLFTESKPSASLPVKLGHIYLIRIVDRSDKSFERIVKILVIAYTPNESVTIRWQVL